MIYYIFEVTDSTGDTYFVINNRYIGYVGFDTDFLRGMLEHNANVKRKYKKIAIISEDSEELHDLFCASKRFTSLEISRLLERYKHHTFEDDIQYEVFYPNRNSSESYLKSECGKVIK
jgi:hypothetical protein